MSVYKTATQPLPHRQTNNSKKKARENLGSRYLILSLYLLVLLLLPKDITATCFHLAHKRGSGIHNSQAKSAYIKSESENKLFLDANVFHILCDLSPSVTLLFWQVNFICILSGRRFSKKKKKS